MAASLRVLSTSKCLKFVKQPTLVMGCCEMFSSKTAEIEDKPTHTGQKWEKDDYRLVRFVNRTKQVNDRFAINLIDDIPPKPVKARSTYCDGGGGPLGHPKVFINLDQPGNHACGYCGLRFYQDDDHHH